MKGNIASLPEQKMVSLENMQFETFAHSSLLGHILWAKEALGQGSQAGWPQVRTLVERLWKRLGVGNLPPLSELALPGEVYIYMFRCR